MTKYIIKKWKTPTGSRFDVPKGMWARTKSGKIAIGCPGCGVSHVAHAINHTVKSNGEVIPSLVCNSGEDCDFHEWVILENWEDND